MRPKLLMVLGGFVLFLCFCGAGCITVFGLSVAIHPQSPLRSYQVAPGATLHGEEDLGEMGDESIELEISRYVAPWKTAPIACAVRATVHTNGKERLLVDETSSARSTGCSVETKVRGSTRVVFDVENRSTESAVFRIAPPIPILRPFLQITWPAWLVLIPFVAAGVALLRVKRR